MNKQTEMRVYEILGVKQFRKLVFCLEKLVHRRDKGLNINYHIPSREAGALEAFVKYLFYNGAIHVRNLVLYIVYLIVKILFRWELGIYDFFLFIHAVKDVYCIILQRYNLLRIRQYQEIIASRRAKSIESTVEKCRTLFAEKYDSSYAEVDLTLVKRIKACIDNHESVILSDEDVQALNRLLSINRKITHARNE